MRDKTTLDPAGLLAALCVIGAAPLLLRPVMNPDIFWHLNAARWMLENLAFPRADWLSHTLSGQPWTDFEWLAELLWHLVYQPLGMKGLWLLKSLCCSAAAALLWHCLGMHGGAGRPSIIGKGIAVLAWALALQTRFDIMADNFSILFFLGLWAWLESRRLRSSDGCPWRVSVGVVALFALWSNLHLGFLYGLALLGIYWAGDALRGRKSDLGRVLLLCCAAALLNPYGFRIYSVAWQHWRSGVELSSYLREWEAPSVVIPSDWPFWGILLTSFSAVLLRRGFLRDSPAEHVAALLAFGLAASRHRRLAAYFCSIALPIAAAALSGPGSRERSPRVRRAFLVSGFAAVWGALVWTLSAGFPRPGFYNPAYLPDGLTRYLVQERAQLAGHRVFNTWHWGGYLGFHLYPDLRVFMDGRYIFHPLLGPSRAARGDPERFAALLDRYSIDIAAVAYDRRFTVDDLGARPFYLQLFPPRRWSLVYWDRKGYAFVRRSAFPEPWIREREFRHFRPDDLDAAAAHARGGTAGLSEVSAEVDRLASIMGEGSDIVLDARRWLRSLGPLGK
ncbi:MAG: hypothetical protein WC728_13745 [Elusimicrobiota bacterium]